MPFVSFPRASRSLAYHRHFKMLLFGGLQLLCSVVESISTNSEHLVQLCSTSTLPLMHDLFAMVKFLYGLLWKDCFWSCCWLYEQRIEFSVDFAKSSSLRQRHTKQWCILWTTEHEHCSSFVRTNTEALILGYWRFAHNYRISDFSTPTPSLMLYTS